LYDSVVFVLSLVAVLDNCGKDTTSFISFLQRLSSLSEFVLISPLQGPQSAAQYIPPHRLILGQI
jgi:hypothetical protein